jgi:glycosyltransferase involved in cell wall biosynthesis
MQILIFSWRDIKHPCWGGAEVLTMELARRWVKTGHRVFIVSSRFPGCSPHEIINGVCIYRPATLNSLSPLPYIRFLHHLAVSYNKHFKNRVDIVLDQVHGVPLFSPFFVREPVIFFPMEVAGNIWFKEIPFPYSIAGYLAERTYIRLFGRYRFLTISPSTAKEIQKYGGRSVTYFQPGVNLPPNHQPTSKSPIPELVSLGRITQMKRLEDTLAAFRLLHKEFPLIRLNIVGQGKEELIQKLKNLCCQMAIEDRVCFLGYITETDKIKLLRKAWLLVSTSTKEGWGLTVMEAAACRTPAVAYRVPGLIDSIIDKRTGLICQRNNPVDLARLIKKVIINPQLRQRLSTQAYLHAGKHTWDKAAKDTLNYFQSIVVGK